MKKQNVRFVYGTLKAGHRLHDRFGLSNNNVATFVGETWLNGYEMRTVGYPIVQAGEGQIFVEIYEIHDDGARNQIDLIEQGAGYVTKLVSAEIDGELIEGYMYIYNGYRDFKDFPKIESGNF